MLGQMNALVVLVVVLVLLTTASHRWEAAIMLAELPEGEGIAAKYPGDLGIEEDPAVVFADGFEDIEDDTMSSSFEKQKGKK